MLFRSAAAAAVSLVPASVEPDPPAAIVVLAVALESAEVAAAATKVVSAAAVVSAAVVSAVADVSLADSAVVSAAMVVSDDESLLQATRAKGAANRVSIMAVVRNRFIVGTFRIGGVVSMDGSEPCEQALGLLGGLAPHFVRVDGEHSTAIKN